MYDPDEIAALVKQYEELVPKLKRPEVRARMIADGRDPDAVLQNLAAGATAGEELPGCCGSRS